MTSRYLKAASPPGELVAGFEAIRAELDVPRGFGTEALEDARAAAHIKVTGADATAIPLVTIDPATSMDLDQAVYIERLGDGYRVHYAIADVPSFVQPDSALATEVWARGLTLYSPDHKTPLHPEILSEDAASLLPGNTRPALVWEIDLDAEAGVRRARVYRARVRSRAKLSYEAVQERLDSGTADVGLALLREVGRLLQAQERARGGVSLPGAEQEIVADGAGYALVLREPLPVEGWNAQISLLTGRVAAQIMLDGGVGILRTMPDPAPADIGRVRAVARSLGLDWSRDEPYSEVIARMNPEQPPQAAFLNAAPSLLRGAGYTPFDGQRPDLATHSAVAAPYAHVTAPLRRLVDRWGLQICLSLCEEAEVPPWVRESLFGLPDAMNTGGRRARALERANIDLVEAFVLQDDVGRDFEAVVLDNRGDTCLVQLTEPPVIARTKGALPLGARTSVRLEAVDVKGRCVTFVPTDQLSNPG